MPKYKVGDKFKVVYSETISQALDIDTVHTLVKVIPPNETINILHYAADTEWFLTEGKTDNTLLVEGVSHILAVLSKIEEPDT